MPSELALYERLKETPEFQDRPAIYEREPGVVLVRGALERIREDGSQGRAIRLWMDWFYDNPHLEPLRKVYPTAKFTFARTEVRAGKSRQDVFVVIRVPPARGRFNYSVQFICGVQPDTCGCCSSVRLGRYATEINIHNPRGREIKIQKRILPLVLTGAARGREPAFSQPTAEDTIVRPPHCATYSATDLQSGTLAMGVETVVAKRVRA